MKREKAIEAVERRIVGVNEAEEFVKILVYGRNGSGKTRFAATAPDLLIADINERGTRSARHSGAKVFHVKKWEDLTYLYWYLREGNHPYKSVCLDTLTMMQHMCMKHVLKDVEDRDPNREPSMPDRRAWGKVGELMKPLMLNFRNLPMNVIFTAQERVMGDPDEDEVVEHVPDLSPGSRGVATACVEVIGHIYQKEIRVVNQKTKKEATRWETRMRVGPHVEYITKDRTGKLGSIIRNPTVPMVIEASMSEED